METTAQTPLPDLHLVDLGGASTLRRRLEPILSSIARVSAGRGTPHSGPPPGHDAAATLLLVDRRGLDRVPAAVSQLGRQAPGLPVLVAADLEGGLDEDLSALFRPGVADVLLHPFRPQEVRGRLRRFLGRGRPRDPLVEKLRSKLGLRRLIGESPAFLDAAGQVPRYAASGATVLITGETGTGKELFARALHYLSERSGRPFVPVNCGALPHDLVENELFGHEKEAYTGAARSRPGLIREAEGGTLFLDEVDALPLQSQVKLLRFLQDKEYRALGSTETQRADVRLVAAANGDVEAAVREGRLRGDLYYRLNVLPLALPPLRRRRSDIPLLARHFVARHASELNRPAVEISPAALDLLAEHDWPGNVRELEHVVERAVVLAEDRPLLGPREIVLAPSRSRPAEVASFKEAKQRAVARFECRYIERLLLAHRGNITRAAAAARKNRRAFFELMRKHQIDARRYRTASQ